MRQFKGEKRGGRGVDATSKWAYEAQHFLVGVQATMLLGYNLDPSSTSLGRIHY
jgi:hypothetical protein